MTIVVKYGGDRCDIYPGSSRGGSRIYKEIKLLTLEGSSTTARVLDRLGLTCEVYLVYNNKQLKLIVCKFK